MFKAFRLFIVTLQDLTRALQANTSECREQRDLLDKITANTAYLSNAKRNDLARSGHRTDF